MPDAFTTSQSEPTPLIEAYELASDPKPPPERIIQLIKKGEIEADRDEDGFYFVRDLDRFEDQLNEWKERTGFNEPAVWNALPAGHVTVAAYVRENVSPKDGRAKRLQDSSSPPQLTQHARVLLSMRDMPTAKMVHHQMWSAPPADIKAWLWRRFGIAVR